MESQEGPEMSLKMQEICHHNWHDYPLLISVGAVWPDNMIGSPIIIDANASEGHWAIMKCNQTDYVNENSFEKPNVHTRYCCPIYTDFALNCCSSSPRR